MYVTAPILSFLQLLANAGNARRIAGAGVGVMLALAGPLCAQDISAPAPPDDAALPQIETVISPEEFAREVPEIAPLDDRELDAPLETLEEFERSFLPRDAVSAPPDPADPELLAPLPPLAGFELATDIEDVASEQNGQAQLSYRYAVEGLGLADRETPADLAGSFAELSALRAGDGKAANRAQLTARLREDASLIERLLASQGWYEARVQREVVEGDEYVATLTIIPGQRYAFSDITIETGELTTQQLLMRDFALSVGEPIIASQVQTAEAQLALSLPQMGYPFVELGQRDILLDAGTGLGEYSLPVTTGPKSVFGSIRAAGDGTFDAGHIAEIARFARGQPYNSALVEDLERAMLATSLFNRVTITPEQSNLDAGGDAQFATLVVEQEAGPPRTIAGSLGYATGEGFQVEGSWTHRNLFPPEGALSLSGHLGTKEQGASALFRRSNAGRRDKSFQLSLEALHADYDAFEAYTGRLAALYAFNSTPLWQKKLSWAVGGQFLVSNEQDYNIATASRERRTFTIAGLSGQLGRDTTDSLLDPSRGYRLAVLVEPEVSLGQGTTAYMRATLDGSAYFALGQSLVLAGRFRLGSVQGIDLYDLAPSRRIYGGGGGSVRGFGYQELGPKVLEPDASNPGEFFVRPTGGRSQAEAAIEARYRFGKYGAVAFVDAGQVYEESLPQFSDTRLGVGLGARYYSDFGPFRLDVALPLDRRSGESKFAVYVSLGQSF